MLGQVLSHSNIPHFDEITFNIHGIGTIKLVRFSIIKIYLFDPLEVRSFLHEDIGI